LDGLTRNGSFHFFKTAGGIFSTITRGGSKSSNGTKENKEDGSYEEKEEGDDKKEEGGDETEEDSGEKRRQLLQPRLPSNLPDPEQVEEDVPDNVNVPGMLSFFRTHPSWFKKKSRTLICLQGKYYMQLYSDPLLPLYYLGFTRHEMLYVYHPLVSPPCMYWILMFVSIAGRALQAGTQKRQTQKQERLRPLLGQVSTALYS
jgi:hypothetical protein